MAMDEAGAFEHGDVPGDGRPGDVEGLDEFADGGASVAEAFDDLPAGGVGKGGEGGAQGIGRFFGGDNLHVRESI
jgi:hypothetical protein